MAEGILGGRSLKNKIALNQHRAKTRHVEGEDQRPATFSHSLPVIPLLMSCPKSPNTVVFDPFMGSGSCGVTALLMGMRFVGVELYDKNIKSAERLLTDIQSQYDEKTLNQILGNNDEDVTEEITETETINQLKSNIRMKLDLQQKQVA